MQAPEHVSFARVGQGRARRANVRRCGLCHVRGVFLGAGPRGELQGGEVPLRGDGGVNHDEARGGLARVLVDGLAELQRGQGVVLWFFVDRDADGRSAEAGKGASGEFVGDRPAETVGGGVGGEGGRGIGGQGGGQTTIADGVDGLPRC